MILPVSTLDEENSVIVIVLHIGIGITLEEAETCRKVVRSCGSWCPVGNYLVLGRDIGIVACNDFVLLLDGAIVVIDARIRPVYGIVIREVKENEVKLVHCAVEEDAERRPADVVTIIPVSIIDAVTVIVINTPMNVYTVTWRKGMNAVTEIVRTGVVENRWMSVLYESPFTWGNSRFHRAA